MVPVPPPVSIQMDLRPQFHYTAPKGWLNDPNGLVYQKGLYHLFYQHNPFGTDWGNMTWGHAVSRDLIHWENLPNALEPDELGTIFSGSAVVDKENFSGFGTKRHPAMVCFYTAAGGTNDLSKGKPFTQCVAWSTDDINIHKFSGNPIVGNMAEGNRDPKVFWHSPTKKWIMVLYLKEDHFSLLGSTDLRHWNRLSDYTLAGTDECPDLFELPIDGDGKKTAWVFWGANGNYQLGTFDGTAFHPISKVQRSHFGNVGYAAQTYSNAPRNRRIQISWFRGSDFPGRPWNQQMGFPNTLTLQSSRLGPALAFWPVREIQKIRNAAVKPVGANFLVPSGLLDFEGKWQLTGNSQLRLTVNGIDITVDRATSKLSALGEEAPVEFQTNSLKLRILADRTSLEIYAQKGAVLMTLFHIPQTNTINGVSILSNPAWNRTLRVYPLNP